MFKGIILGVGLLMTGTLGDVASYIKPCAPTDSACMVKAAEIALPKFVKGIEEFGIRPMDPLTVKDINSSTDGLILSFKNVVIHGLANCKFNKIERDLAKSTILIDVECPVECVGNYKAGGKLLVLDIEGEGPFNITCDKLHMTFDIKLKESNKEGTKYNKILSYNFKYEPLCENVHIELDNLFNGDKTKAKPVVNALNENGKAVMLGPGKEVFVKIVKDVMAPFSKFLENVPANQYEN